MAKAISQTKDGLTFGIFGLGLHGAQPGSVAQQVHDGDTVSVRALGNLSIRFLGIDTPEVSFTLPGTSTFGKIDSPAWESFLADPFSATLPALILEPALQADLVRRAGPGAAKNHADHAAAAHKALEKEIEADMNTRGLTKDGIEFFAAFTREIADRYGRLLAFLNIRDQSATRPADYNTRMLEKGLATPYFIWPNIDPWRSKGSLTEAALPPEEFRAQANQSRSLRAAREAVAAARNAGIGIFDAAEPLRLHAFELRFLAQRRAPERWVIDLGGTGSTLLKPQSYHKVAKVEDRLFVPADHVPLFTAAGWVKE
jgi:endonuclease YncB( thermonuclease family)